MTGIENDQLSDFYRGFSEPSQPLDYSLFEYLVVEHSRALAQEFLDRHGNVVSSASPSLFAFLRGAIDAVLEFETVWSPAWGALAACLAARDAASIHNAAVAFAWKLSQQGIPGQWEASCIAIDRLLIGDMVLPLARRISVESAPGKLTVTVSETGDANRDTTYRFNRTESGYWLVQDSRLDQPKNAMLGRVLFLTNGVSDIANFQYLRELLLPAARVNEAIDKHRSAMALLDEFAPSYAMWVNRVVRAIIPLEAMNGAINSGSNREEPGIIHASVDCPVEGYAEMLVHEAAHQYFYILTRIGQVDNGTDPTLYYSPVKETGRPISMILLAYHAFANVILLGRCCNRKEPGRFDYFYKNESFLEPHVSKLEEGLRTTRALTIIGRALWQPLSERLGMPQ